MPFASCSTTLAGMSRRQITSTARARTAIPESKAHASSMEEARRAMELSRQRMYADRSKRNRTIMLYTTGSVSLGGHRGARGYQQGRPCENTRLLWRYREDQATWTGEL